MRVILIAETDADGLAWLARQPAAPADVVTVTPRSPDRPRGVEADAVLITPAAAQLPDAVLAPLRELTLVCVLARRRS